MTSPKMEVDVRLFFVAVLSLVVRGDDNDTIGANETIKVFHTCRGCSGNKLSMMCRQFDNGSVSCSSCQKNHANLICDKCSSSMNISQAGLKQFCSVCQCNGSFDLVPSQSCASVNGACHICQSNFSSWYCERCVSGYHDSGAVAEKCMFMNIDVKPTKKKSGFSTKEKIIVTVCCTVGVLCIIFIVFLLYRHHKIRTCKAGRPFWTVELTNRNYDDLDFSLLDPITDIPFVYRTDISDFDNDALLGCEKPQLIMEVDDGEVLS